MLMPCIVLTIGSNGLIRARRRLSFLGKGTTNWRETMLVGVVITSKPFALSSFARSGVATMSSNFSNAFK